ncbi:CopD family protein [Brachybacterium sp. EF45031]|uniref:copper resistance D family protein n=1 Tax=Brachybacterium sillae TaxID=2810536 RepID=UPI00217DA65D|nr:CopD family protein [Brachybacterium sillae]MCS6712188.1 CopD family protein [Brachybacterium sillae]
MPSRPLRQRVIALCLGLVLAALVAVGAAALAEAGNPVLIAADTLTRRGGAPVAVVADIAGSLCLGAALLAGWVLREDHDRARALMIAAITAGVWTLAQLLGLLLGYSLATGQALTDPAFGSDLGVYLGTDLGLWQLIALITAAASTAVAILGTSGHLARAVTGMAVLALAAKGMTGHAAGNTAHEVATSTMALHLVAVGVWVGGLIVLQLLPARSRDDAAVLHRFSALALACWVTVGASGLWALAVRMTGPSDVLTSVYVQLALAKAVLLLALGGLGHLQRRELARRVEDGEVQAVAAYRHLAALEIALMLGAIALAAALSSSPPPADDEVPPLGPAAILTGYPLPPEPTLTTALTAWRPEPLSIAATAFAVLVAVRARGTATRRRVRAVALALISVVLLLVLSGPLAVYAKVLASAYLVSQALLLAVAGPLIGLLLPVPRPLRRLVAGRPVPAIVVTCALAAVEVAALLSPLLRAAAGSHVAHLALVVLPLLAGAGIALTARAYASGPGRPEAVRLAVAAPAVLLGAALLVALIGDAVLAPSWFGATGRAWWADALVDQRRGAAIALTVVALAQIVAQVGIRRAHADQALSPGTTGQSKISRTPRSRSSSSARSDSGS